MSLWRREDISIKQHLIFMDRSWLDDSATEGNVLANNKHKDLAASKLCDHFSVNHVEI
jgi:hypothetical protein